MNPETQILHDLLKETRADIRGLGDKMDVMTVEQVRQNSVLEDHDRRHTKLEKIVKPIVALDGLYKVVVILGGFCGAIYAAMQLFRH